MTFPIFPTACLAGNTPLARWTAFREAINPEIIAATPPDPLADFFTYHERKIRKWRGGHGERKRHYE
jgi:hypothetical protein